MIKKLSHVCLGTTDLQRTIDFYCNFLGCKVVHEFRSKQGQLYGIFLLVNDGTFLEFFIEQSTAQCPSLFRHLCFEVEDIHRWAKVVEEAGFAVEVKRGRTDGVLQFWIEDPDGTQVEFHQYDEQSVQYKYVAYPS